MDLTLPLGRVVLAVRFAALDHLVGFDLRLDQPDRYVTLLIGVPFVSFKVAVYRPEKDAINRTLRSLKGAP